MIQFDVRIFVRRGWFNQPTSFFHTKGSNLITQMFHGGHHLMAPLKFGHKKKNTQVLGRSQPGRFSFWEGVKVGSIGFGNHPKRQKTQKERSVCQAAFFYRCYIGWLSGSVMMFIRWSGCGAKWFNQQNTVSFLVRLLSHRHVSWILNRFVACFGSSFWSNKWCWSIGSWPKVVQRYQCKHMTDIVGPLSKDLLEEACLFEFVCAKYDSLTFKLSYRTPGFSGIKSNDTSSSPHDV